VNFLALRHLRAFRASELSSFPLPPPLPLLSLPFEIISGDKLSRSRLGNLANREHLKTHADTPRGSLGPPAWKQITNNAAELSKSPSGIGGSRGEVTAAAFFRVHTSISLRILATEPRALRLPRPLIFSTRHYGEAHSRNVGKRAATSRAFHYRLRLRNRGWSLPTLYGPGTSSFHIVSRLALRRDSRASDRASVLHHEIPRGSIDDRWTSIPIRNPRFLPLSFLRSSTANHEPLFPCKCSLPLFFFFFLLLPP